MGNNHITTTTNNNVSQDVKWHIGNIKGYRHKVTLGVGKIFKTLQCSHEDGDVIIKLYIKKDLDINLKKYELILNDLRSKFTLRDQPGIIISQTIKEMQYAAYLVRQYFAYNLFDRFHAQPFLDDIEKKWIVYQLLRALIQCHDQNICHGDLKCENILCTSWNWIFLTDFAFYKPTYLPADNPADYSHFFDTGHRRRCYLACERFFNKLNHDHPEKKKSFTCK